MPYGISRVKPFGLVDDPFREVGNRKRQNQTTRTIRVSMRSTGASEGLGIQVASVAPVILPTSWVDSVAPLATTWTRVSSKRLPGQAHTSVQ
jgi:hypothetical protein